MFGIASRKVRDLAERLSISVFAKELGAESYPVTAIGGDELGDETFTVLKETGLDLGYISRNILPTGKVLVSLNEVPVYRNMRLLRMLLGMLSSVVLRP